MKLKNIKITSFAQRQFVEVEYQMSRKINKSILLEKYIFIKSHPIFHISLKIESGYGYVSLPRFTLDV